MMALRRRGGGGADKLLSFLEWGMIRRPEEVVEEERGEAGQVLRERYVLFFPLLHRRLGGMERKGEREKGQMKYFPLWQRKWGKVERADSVLRNGLNHSQEGCWKSQPHRPLTKCTYQWWMILTFTLLCFFVTPQCACVCVSVLYVCVCVQPAMTLLTPGNPWPPQHSQGVENISPATIDSYPQLTAPSAVQHSPNLQWLPLLLILCPTTSCFELSLWD